MAGLVYPDTSLLLPAYVREAHSGRARSLLAGLDKPLGISELTRLEMENALRLRVFRKELGSVAAASVIHRIDKEIAAGIYVVIRVEERRVWPRARKIAARFSDALGCRSLDIWHAAFALEAGAAELWTLDDRQRRLATGLGLKVKPLA